MPLPRATSTDAEKTPHRDKANGIQIAHLAHKRQRPNQVYVKWSRLSRGKYLFFQFLTTLFVPKTHIGQILFESPKEELDLPPATNVRFTKRGIYDLVNFSHFNTDYLRY